VTFRSLIQPSVIYFDPAGPSRTCESRRSPTGTGPTGSMPIADTALLCALAPDREKRRPKQHRDDRSICMFLSPRLNRTIHENAGWHSILARPGPQSAHTRVVSRAGGQSPLWVVNRVILVVGRPLPTFPWKRTSFLRTRCDFLVIPFQAEIEERPMTKPGLFLA
jgi:hypothetical protein